jgi:glycosyltransferase involved in cell wall biosynthesis
LDVPLNTLVDYKNVPIRFFARTTSPISAVREFNYSSTFKTWLKANIDNYDVIHVHAIFSFVSSYTMWLARKRKHAYVVRTIGQLEDWSLNQSKRKKDWYLTLIERTNLEAANAIHFTADSEREQALKRFPMLSARTIPLGIDKNEPLNKPVAPTHWRIKPNIPIICYISRLHQKKGLELLLEALATINSIDFQFLIAGAGDSNYVSSLKALVKKLNLQEKCQFIGYVEGQEKQLLLESSDIFALTSYSENFGIAVLEAMAAGATPLVSKEVALADVIAKNSLGAVCALTVADISRHLGELLSNKVECQNSGDRAKYFVEQHFQWTAIATELRELYHSIQ